MDFTSLASLFGMGGGADAGASAGSAAPSLDYLGGSQAPPNAAGAFDGSNPNYGAPQTYGNGFQNFMNKAMQIKGSGGGGNFGTGTGGVGNSPGLQGMSVSGGYGGGKL
jgi:hypothetical protein